MPIDGLMARDYIDTMAAKLWRSIVSIYGDSAGNCPPIEYELKASGIAGKAYYSGKIVFNIAYIMALDRPELFDETIAHELAHIVQYRLYPKAKQAHGVEFRDIMLWLGYSGNTYHDYNSSKAKNIAKANKGIDLLLSL